MAHRRDGSLSPYNYPILVDTTDCRPRATHCPTGAPDDSLWGKTLACWNRPPYLAEIPGCWNRPTYLAERLISKSNKNKVRDVDTPETDLSEDVARGHPVSIGKLITTGCQDECDDVNGTSAAGNGNTDHEVLDNEFSVAVVPEPEANEEEEDDDESFFDSLYEYALDNEFEENEEVDYDAVLQHDDDHKESDVGAAVVVPDDQHDDKRDEDDPTSGDDDEDEDDDNNDSLHDPPIGWLDVKEIDADWLQRFISFEYGTSMGMSMGIGIGMGTGTGMGTGMGTERRQKLADDILKFLGEGNDSELERVMDQEAWDPHHFVLPMYMTVNRWKIVWCTRLARAQNKLERKKIEKEMRTLGRPHTLVLKQVRAARRAANEEEKENSEKMTNRKRKPVGSMYAPGSKRQIHDVGIYRATYKPPLFF